MRAILFRGKAANRENGRSYRTSYKNGDWVYGLLTDTENYAGFAEMTNTDGVQGIEVDKRTVGQFTGVTDKNGKRIFEGDVVRYNTFDDFNCHSIVKFGEYEQDGSAGEYNPRSCIGWYCEVDNFTAPDWAEEDPTFFFNSYLEQQNLLEVNDDCEVIGNIYDNPELVRAKE